MNMLDRDKKIYDARQSGRTLKDIGKEFSLSPARIKSIVDKEERRIRRGDQNKKETWDDNDSIDDLQLSVRARCCVLNNDIRTVGQLRKIDRKTLMKTPNFGAVSMREIESIIGPLSPPKSMKWQPIETAPKDYTDIILFDPEYDNDWHKTFEGWFDPDLRKWFSAFDKTVVYPTHWMPLPEPPE